MDCNIKLRRNEILIAQDGSPLVEEKTREHRRCGMYLLNRVSKKQGYERDLCENSSPSLRDGKENSILHY